MTQCTTNTYEMKREIINFSKKLSEGLSQPERKFYTDMTYGMLASGSCLLTDIAQTLQEGILKINVVDRLSRHLAEEVPSRAMWNYLKTIRCWAPTEPVIHIDDSDVIKPDGYHFEALGVVRNGSKSTKEKSIYCNADSSEEHTKPRFSMLLRGTLCPHSGGRGYFLYLYKL